MKKLGAVIGVLFLLVVGLAVFNSLDRIVTTQTATSTNTGEPEKASPVVQTNGGFDVTGNICVSVK